MRLRNKLFSVLLVMCLAVVPFALSGCVGGGGSGGGNSGGGSGGGESGGGETPSGPDMTEYFAGVDTAYIDSTTADAEIVEKYKTLANSIMDALNNVYGENGSGVPTNYVGSFEYNGSEMQFNNTHLLKSSPEQDLWGWGKDNQSVFTENNKNLMAQNIFEAVLGLNISDSYLESSLMTYASKVDHKGLFYYEADAIAEYILNYVIGTDVVALDNEKFVDLDNNGTYDNNYYFFSNKTNTEGRFGFYNQIKDYSNTNKRATNSTKSTRWNTINFGVADLSGLEKINNEDVYTEKGVLLEYLFDGAYTVNKMHFEVEGVWKFDHPISNYEMVQDFLANPSLDYKYLSKGDTYKLFNEFYLDEKSYGHMFFSCFKNYVNTIYKIVYETIADLNWGIETKAISDFASINDYGMSTGDESFTADSTNYRSITLLAKKDIIINTISLFFELDSSVTTSVVMDVFANYVRKEDGVQVSTKAKLGSITINPGKYDITDNDNSVVFDMTIESNDDFSQSTEFYPLGIKEFKLAKANEPYGKYTIAPSDSFIGSSTSYVDPNNDFVELSFVIKTNGKQNIKYKFGFLGIAVE